MSISVILEFSGGAELLVGNKKRHDVTLPARAESWNLQVLLLQHVLFSIFAALLMCVIALLFFYVYIHDKISHIYS